MTIHVDIGDIIFGTALLVSSACAVGFMLGSRSGERLGRMLGKTDSDIEKLRREMRNR